MHLRRVLRAGFSVGWVPMPAIYGAERSSFRAGRDSAAVLWALVRPLEPSVPATAPIATPSRLPTSTSGQEVHSQVHARTPPPARRARAAVA